MKLSKNLKKIGVPLFKIIAILVAWGYVYYKFTQMSSDVFLLFFDNRFTIVLLAVLLLLMIVNWGLEIIKWKFLVDKIHTISWLQAIKGVCVGLPLGFVTPNRIGEIGGRAIVVDKNYKKVMFATFIGSFMQLITTLLFALIGFILYRILLPQQTYITYIFYGFILVSICVSYGIFAVSKKRWIRNFFLRVVSKSYYKKVVRVFQLYTSVDVVNSLIFSVLRYVVFCSQFCILLYVFIPELSLLMMFVGVTFTYFFTTVIPTSILGEIGIRGSVAMVIFGMFTQQELVVFQISLLLWVINIVIPTLLGTWFLIGIKKGKNQIHDNSPSLINTH